MKRLNFLLILALIFGVAFTSDNAKLKTPEVLTLGVFHFNFPNLDVVQIAKEDQIDVLLPEHQKEIELIVEKLLLFQPTIIVIECQPAYQHIIDSLYHQYLLGKHLLRREEIEQIGFRIAKAMGLQKLYCVDEWGNFTENISNLMNNQKSEEFLAFAKSFENNSELFNERLFKTKGILAELVRKNDEKNIKRDLGSYLIGPFKHEFTPYDFTGVDFETGRWFSRNLKIFRNIQRIDTRPEDRILVIYGSGHLSILNYLFECSPEYTLVRTNDFLK
ncbi:MAG: DUF5694 domain-containing protein [Bacteroidales bacterium]|nr:DUF5694 domain-containing protein [Bacteroidales bacterium]